MKPDAPSALALTDCRVLFCEAATRIKSLNGVPALAVALPVLAGGADEIICTAEAPVIRGNCVLFCDDGFAGGFAIASPSAEIEAVLELRV